MYLTPFTSIQYLDDPRFEPSTYQSRQPSEEAAVLEVLAADDVPDAREPVGHDHVEAQHEKEEGKTEEVK